MQRTRALLVVAFVAALVLGALLTSRMPAPTDERALKVANRQDRAVATCPPSQPCACAPAAAPTRTSAAATTVLVLGSGTPIMTARRAGPALAIVASTSGGAFRHTLLVDAGPSVVRQLVLAQARGIAGADPLAIAAVFLTHLHSDHTVGLADLLLSPLVVGRETPLAVYGPPGTASLVRHILASAEEDLAIRYGTRELDVLLAMHARVVELYVPPAPERLVVSPSVGRAVHVEAFRVSHGEWAHAFGYRFVGQADGRTIVVSGDTGPAGADAVAAACVDGTGRPCHVLVHEVFSGAWLARDPNLARVEYHSSFHTSARALAELAVRTQAATLVTTHMLFFGSTESQFAIEMSDALAAVGFAGELVIGEDFDVI